MPLTHESWQFEVTGFLLSLVGAIIAYLFGKGTQPTSKYKLVAVFPGRTNAFYARLDAVLIILLGAVIAHYSFIHRGPMDCLASGISFSASLKALLKTAL